MASHPDAPVKDEHLEEAVLFAFDHCDEVVTNVKKALIDQSKRASRPDHRRYLTSLLERFENVHDYWKQMFKDYPSGLDSPPKNIKSFIDVVREKSFDAGYKKGLSEIQALAYSEGLEEGYTEGFENGCIAQPQPFKHAALGFALCLTLGAIIHYVIPGAF